MTTTINGKLANSAQVLDGLEANLSPRGPAQDQYVVTYNEPTGTLILTPGGGGSGMANPMTTLGDIIFGQSGGTPGRLPIATPGYTLRVGAGGVPEWSENAAFGPLATRPAASGLNEGESWWVTDASSGLELSFSVHTGSGVWGWVTLPYGVTATGKSLVQAINPAGGRSALELGNSATLNVGTTAGTVAAGDDTRLSNARVPTGSAGGDLGGSYPNPTVTSGTNHSHTASQVSDASANGRSLMTAANYAAMRSLMGVAVNGYMGAICIVDQSLGSDLTGAREGLPFATITAAIAAATAGDCVWVMPGTYNESLTIPEGVSVRGIDMRSVTVQQLSVTGDTTLITMGESSHLTNVTLRLTSSGHHTLVGVDWPGTTTQTALLESSEIYIDNSGASVGGTSTVVGCYSTGSGADHGAAIRSVMMWLNSVGGGTKRGIVVAGTATLHVHDFEVHVMSAGGSGSYIGAETTNAGAVLRLHFGAVEGTTADISRTLGAMDLGNVNLINANANGFGFTALLGGGLIPMVYADDGATSSGTRYMRPGTAPATATEQFVRLPGKTMIRSISVRAAVGPGDARTDTWTVRINGVDTPVAVSLTGAATTAVTNTTSAGSSVAFDLSVKQVCASGSTTSDVVVVIGLY